MVTAAPGVLAAVAVAAIAATGTSVSRWAATNRVLARLDVAPAPVRPVPGPVGRALDRAGVEADHRTLFHSWLAALALALAATAVVDGGPVLLAVVAIAPPGALLACQGRAARLRIRQLPLALDAVAAGLRGGASLEVAVRDAASIGGTLGAELGRIADHAAAGRPLADALAAWAEEAEDPSSRLAAAALVVAAELGGPGARAIDAAAASLRDRASADDEIGALSVQARLSALLLTAAPVVFAFLLTSIDPTSARFLLGTRAGWACIVGGLVLDGIGAAWMARLVRVAR